MKKNIQEICNSIVEEYKQDKNILGILLFGSVLKNKFDKYSDIDIYILLNKKGEFSRRSFVKNGIRVDIILSTIKETENYLKEDKKSLQRVTSQMLANSKILFQKGRKLEKIQILAGNNLKSGTIYKKGDILMNKYSIDDFWGEVRRDIKNNDYLAFGTDSYLLISNIVELFLRLNGEYLRQPNEMTKILRNLNKVFSDQIEAFYRADCLKNKEQILSDLVKYIYTKSKGPLPEEWYLEN